MLFELVKRFPVIHRAASWFFSMVNPFVEHNLQKYGALRKALFLTGMEQLEGDYLEFGVFTGSSLIYAARFHRRLDRLGKSSMRFFGFDSFQGFGAADGESHPFYIDDNFKVDANKIMRDIQRATKGSDVKIVPGFFETTLQRTSAKELGISRARIVFIDCDLGGPAKLALQFALPALQVGTILIMDDYFAFKGGAKDGLCGAFQSFRDENPSLEFRRLFDYGYGGIAFIVSSLTNQATVPAQREVA